jgi:hypothetical protein
LEPIYERHPSGSLRARSSAGEHLVDIEGVTGSIPVAPTIQSAQTAGDNTIRKKGLFAGIFDVVLIAISSLRIVIVSPQPILTIRLCSRKFRSWRLSSERQAAERKIEAAPAMGPGRVLPHRRRT